MTNKPFLTFGLIQLVVGEWLINYPLTQHQESLIGGLAGRMEQQINGSDCLNTNITDEL